MKFVLISVMLIIYLLILSIHGNPINLASKIYTDLFVKF